MKTNNESRIQETRGELYPKAPFDFEKSLSFIGGFSPMKNEQSLESSTMVKAFSVRKIPVVMELSSTGTVDSPKLSYVLYSEEALSDRIRDEAIERMDFFLSLSDDLSAFYALAEQDDEFEPVLQRHYGYHQVKFMTPFENACWSILVQRNPMPAARQLKRYLYETYGRSLVVRGEQYATFPEPADLLEANMEQLVETLGSRRAEYIQAVAAAFSQTEESFMKQGDYAAVREWLLGIKGIGEWSAQFILIRGLGRMEQIPWNEKAALAAASAVYHERMSPQRLQEIADYYGIYQGYWLHYLRINHG
ncbi:DNA-3-methyladenine glycosylase family protein [Paenibacillus sp. GCM10027628]|uniref:DNA-3-methyladenine glycosylase family protein n=1 Tax=Paenibacillus sp. GCM10027628 TaxID=3273413 RepID=UPI0036414820